MTSQYIILNSHQKEKVVIRPGLQVHVSNSVVSDLVLPRGSFQGSCFENSDVCVYGDECDLSNIRGVSSRVAITGNEVTLDSGLFRSGTSGNINLVDSSLFDFEIRDTPGYSLALGCEGSDLGNLENGVKPVLVSVANSDCKLFKIERAVATISMTDCDLTDSTFYRCAMTARFSNCTLRNAEFVDVRLSSDSTLTFSSRSTTAFRGLSRASFVDCILPRRFYELAVSVGSLMDHVEVIPEDMDLF